MANLVLMFLFSFSFTTHNFVTGKNFSQLYTYNVIYTYAATFNDGDVRLVGGSYQWEGRVEVFFNRSWGTITDSDWTSEDAQAVCRTLGYFRPGETYLSDYRIT